MADAGVPVQPERPDPAAEAAEEHSGPETFFQDVQHVMASQPCPYCQHELGEHVPACEKGMHTGRPCGCAGPKATAQFSAAEAAKEARPPINVAQAIAWIDGLLRIRDDLARDHRPGTGPAYRAEGEHNALTMALNVLRYGDPEPPTGA